MSKVEVKSPGNVTELTIFPTQIQLDEVSELFPSSNSPTKVEQDKAKKALQQLLANEDGVLAKVDHEVVKRNSEIERAEAEFVNLVQSFNDDEVMEAVNPNPGLTIITNRFSERKRSTARYEQKSSESFGNTAKRMPRASLDVKEEPVHTYSPL